MNTAAILETSAAQAHRSAARQIKCTEAGSYADPSARREYHHARYLANRQAILAKAAAKSGGGWQTPSAQAASAGGNSARPGIDWSDSDWDAVEDVHPFIERNRRDTLESIRLRLIWASSAGGDEGVVAAAAVAVIRFAEVAGGRWTDRALRTLHIRLSLAKGLTPARFEAAKQAIARDLFVPL